MEETINNTNSFWDDLFNFLLQGGKLFADYDLTKRQISNNFDYSLNSIGFGQYSKSEPKITTSPFSFNNILIFGIIGLILFFVFKR